MPAHFPKTGDDGSFKVRVRFSGSPRIESSTVQQWLNTWTEQNAEWTTFDTTHSFYDYFTAEPRVERGPDGELCVLLYGASDSERFWKDWYARICISLRRDFPEIGDVLSVENA